MSFVEVVLPTLHIRTFINKNWSMIFSFDRWQAVIDDLFADLLTGSVDFLFADECRIAIKIRIGKEARR